MNNIYQLIKEYRSQKNEKDKKLFMMALEHSTRRSLKNLIMLQNDHNRFDHMYEGWISIAKEEMLLLEVYSFVLEVVDYLKQYCVSKATKKEFDDQQKVMIKLLLKNRRYYEVAQLLEIRMEDESFAEEKMLELKKMVQTYLKKRGFKIPDKFNEQIFSWVAARRFPPYMLVGYPDDLTFPIYNETIDSNTLALKIAKAMENRPRNVTKVINELIKDRDLKS